jgi:surface polysaccharide O-acyltransferase-like enzyme
MTRRLALLSGLAILGVVLNHALGWGLVAMLLWADRYRPVAVPNFDQVGSASYYVLRLLEQFVVFAVPAFLLVSGYFVATSTGRSQTTVSWKVVWGRVKTLVIPYLVWCLILIGGRLLEGETSTIPEYLRLIATGALAGPYWFLPLLIQLYLLSPLLVRFAKSHWRLLLLISALGQLATQVLLYPQALRLDIPFLPDGFYIGWFFPTRLFWFSLGIVAGFHLQDFKLWLDRAKWSALASTMIFFVIGVLEWEWIFRYSHFITVVDTVVDSAYAASFLFAFLAFDVARLPLVGAISGLGTMALGIYLVHVPAQEYSARLMYHFTPRLLEYQILLWAAVFVAGLFGPIGLMEIVKRSPAKRLYSMLFG